MDETVRDLQGHLEKIALGGFGPVCMRVGMAVVIDRAPGYASRTALSSRSSHANFVFPLVASDTMCNIGK